MALAAAAIAIAVAISSAGCLVEEEKPGPAKVTVPDDREDARLVVDGLVGTPLNWTLQQVVDLGTVDFKATFVNSVGATLTSNFTGVRVRAVLEAAAACATAEMLEVEASDGYTALIFLSDLSNDSYLAVKEEGKWLNLSDSGALRFVDTHMASVYWVKMIVAMHLKRSASLSISDLGGHFPASNITAAELHARANVTVTWREGTRTRTAMGMDMRDVGRWLHFAASFLELLGPGQQRVVHNATSAWDDTAPDELKDYLAVDSKGRFVFVSDGSALATGFTGLRHLNGIDIHGDVKKAIDVTMTDLDGLPSWNVTVYRADQAAHSLEDILGLAGIEEDATTVLIGPGNGTTMRIPVAELSNYSVIETDRPWASPPMYELVLLRDDKAAMGFFVVAWADVRSA